MSETKSAKERVLEVSKSATLSGCGFYRYRLYRSWADGPFVVFLMFNPSTADAERDDATIRKCIGFAKSWAYPGLTVINLFALRSTDPRAVNKCSYEAAVGPHNDEQIMTALATAGELICAWGCSQHMQQRRDRARKVLRLIRETYPALPIRCLGKSKDGTPRHPLMLSYATLREEF